MGLMGVYGTNETFEAYEANKIHFLFTTPAGNCMVQQ